MDDTQDLIEIKDLRKTWVDCNTIMNNSPFPMKSSFIHSFFVVMITAIIMIITVVIINYC